MAPGPGVVDGVGAVSALRRAAPWVLCAISLVLFAVGIWLRSRNGEPAASENGWLHSAFEAFGFGGIPVVGALIASRLPANPYGWLWCAIGLVAATASAGSAIVRALDAPLWGAWLFGGWGLVTLIGLLVFVFLLFPTGRLPDPGWQWAARAAVTVDLLLMLAVPFLYDTDDPASATPWAPVGTAGAVILTATVTGVFLLFGLALAAMASLVVRFRRADPAQRLQLTWFLYATAVNAVILVLTAVLGVISDGLLESVVSAVGFALLPLAVGVAVLRYRLYEIDRIVSRTVSWGLLTAALVGLYLVVVALLRPVLEPLTGGSALAVAASTLAVAAVFNPVRRRLQEAVDRRFDRARYDAARAVDAFAARLRDQIELDQVGGGRRDTVAATVAPTGVGVWLREPREV